MKAGVIFLLWLGVCAEAFEPALIEALLKRSIIGPDLALEEVERFTESRVPEVPQAGSAAEWEAIAARLRRETLDQVVFRGKARHWRDAKTGVAWGETIEGGPGYRIKKLRYEALPGLWIPALLYLPDPAPAPGVAGTAGRKVPVALAVNGHEGIGKSVPYKQLRCINLAKRGTMVLNTEWIGMGQLNSSNYVHYRMNQLDLCGVSGLAPFYLSMSRALDILLEQPNADPGRVSVSGLSGGGWQTIFISALDTRVKLSNPVAGYSSFKTRARHHSDLGDSEQTPCDLATVVDYAHLTAMMAPRPTLLTFNAKDNCCFASPHAMQPLVEAALPKFKLYGAESRLRTHVNFDPGDHNFGVENREAFYEMTGDYFHAGEPFSAKEIESESEVKSNAALIVELPTDNENFNTLARTLSRELPRERRPAAAGMEGETRKRLARVVRAHEYSVKAEEGGSEETGGVKATFWRLKMEGPAGEKAVADRSVEWTVPAVELARAGAEPGPATLLICDTGRAGAANRAARLVEQGRRVIAIDPFYFGESKIKSRDFLFALLVAAVGERPIGIQASQVGAVARWAAGSGKGVQLVALGPRSSTFGLIAAALEEKAIGSVELNDPLGSLKQVIEENWTVDKRPELFCFGLLEEFDLEQIEALVKPTRKVERGEKTRSPKAE